MHAIHESAVEAKRMTGIIGADTATKLPMNLPAPIAASLLPAVTELMARSGITPFNTLITNVPGIQQPLYLAGAEMVALMGIIPVVDQMGLTHAVFSYNGKLSIAFTGWRDMLPDPDFYARCLEASYAELRDAALHPKRSGAARPAAGKTAKKTARKANPEAAARKKAPKIELVKRPLKKKALKKKALKKKARKKKARKKKTGKRPSTGATG